MGLGSWEFDTIHFKFGTGIENATYTSLIGKIGLEKVIGPERCGQNRILILESAGVE